MIFQFFRCRETYTVNSLQHLVLAVALPVSTGMSDQLKVAAKLYIFYVRSTAEIREIPLLIACDISIFQTVDQIQLVLIILEHFLCFFFGDFLTDDSLTGFADLFHFLFDLLDIFIADDSISKIHIIVETLCYNRSYPEFCLWIQMLDRLCHHMGTGMVKCLQLFVFFKVYHFRFLS